MRSQDTDLDPGWETLLRGAPISRFLGLCSYWLRLRRWSALGFAFAFFHSIRQHSPIRRHLDQIATVDGAERGSGQLQALCPVTAIRASQVHHN
jgi:hypothetical protein